MWGVPEPGTQVRPRSSARPRASCPQHRRTAHAGLYPQALPNGHISPALFVALRVLCAPDDVAASWTSIADALRLPAAAGSEEEGEAPHLGVVQVWPVLDADGQPLAAGGTAAAGDQQQGYAALLNRGMCELLQEEVEQRMGAYAYSLAADLAQLAQQAQLEDGPSTAADAAAAEAEAEAEQRVAKRAALMLRVTEKEVLHGLLDALEQRLAVLPPAAAAPDEKAAAAGAKKKQQKQQKAAGKEPAAGKQQKSAGKQGGGKRKAVAPAEKQQQGGSSRRKSPRSK